MHTETITTINDEATGIPVEMNITAFLSAAECNAQSEMSLPLLTQKLIDAATAHANALHVGYEDLVKDNTGWVLSRISIEMTRYPAINEDYSITTWVEGFNRRFSARNFMISDSKGDVIGYVRSIWVAIDFATRRPVDLSVFEDRIIPSSRQCPIATMPRLANIENPERVVDHHFSFCDIDFNRHVNSARYVETILNQWDVAFYDRNIASRFDIVFLAEIHFDDEVKIAVKQDSEGVFDVALAKVNTGFSVATRARLSFSPR